VYEARSKRDIQFKIKGRGGTSFEPVFDYIRENKMFPDVLIYLTDGYALVSLEKPPYPVIWVTTGSTNFPFGEVIEYDIQKEVKS